MRIQGEHTGETKIIHRLLISTFHTRGHLWPQHILALILNVYFLNTYNIMPKKKNSTHCPYDFLCYMLSLILIACLQHHFSQKVWYLCSVSPWPAYTQHLCWPGQLISRKPHSSSLPAPAFVFHGLLQPVMQNATWLQQLQLLLRPLNKRKVLYCLKVVLLCNII